MRFFIKSRTLARVTLLMFVSMILVAQATDQFVSQATKKRIEADWLIVGAGPAGIAVVGILLDNGVPAKRIVWLDPEFNVGRIGAYYQSVPGNLKTKIYVNFINACRAFQGCTAESLDRLKAYDQEKELQLYVIAEPLQDITNYLRSKVNSVQDFMSSLYFRNDAWQVSTTSKKFTAKHVVLATGSHPKTLDYETSKVIPLDVALNQKTLRALVTKDDVVGVVGSAHSAILLLKFLAESSAKHIYNFYNKPIVYSQDMGGWFTNPGTGVKGVTAEWARNVLEKGLIKNLTRIKSSPESLKEILAKCTKAIYAVGYKPNTLPTINGGQSPTVYDDTTGIIAPRLFGIGLAFPELATNPAGQTEHVVGLPFFMSYIQRMVPEWLDMYPDRSRYTERVRAQYRKLVEFKELFEINVL